MQLSKSTVEVLRNFSDINPSILITPGNRLVSFANDGGVLANAEVEDEFTSRFGIYDLNSFLSLTSLIDDPVLDTANSDKYVTISGNGTKYKFFVAKESLLRIPPKTELELPSEDIKFSLDDGSLKRVLRAAAVLSLDTVCFYSSDNGLYFGASDPKQQDSDSFSVRLDDYKGPEFKLFVSISKLTLLPGNYDIAVCYARKPMMVLFTNVDRDVRYWAGAELDSYVEEEK